MYSASASKLISARFSQRTFKRLAGTPRPSAPCPLTHYALHVILAGEFLLLCFCEPLPDLLNLPLVYGHVFPDSFSGDEGPAASLRFG
jgi:hypothetical protein